MSVGNTSRVVLMVIDKLRNGREREFFREIEFATRVFLDVVMSGDGFATVECKHKRE